MQPVGGRLADERVDDLLNERVEPCGRLVEDEELRPVHQRQHQPDLLPVTLRERSHGPVELELQSRGEALASADVVHAAQRGEVAQVLSPGQALVQPQVAGQVADTRANPPTLRAHVEPEHLGPAGARADQVEQQPDRRRLPGTVQAQIAENLPDPHRERQIADADCRPVVLRETRHADRLTGHDRRLGPAAGARIARSPAVLDGRRRRRGAKNYAYAGRPLDASQRLTARYFGKRFSAAARMRCEAA